MFAFLLVFLSFTALGHCEFDPLSQEYIDHINSLNITWKAQQNFPGRTIDEVQKLCGTVFLKDDPLKPPLQKGLPLEYPIPIPPQFDARMAWPHCATIHQISDQGHCGSCWAFSSASVINDRYCILYNKYLELSTQDMVSCCAPAYGHKGCDSAPLTVPYDCWMKIGIVTGGQFGTNVGCQPYSIPSCPRHQYTADGFSKVSIPDCNKDPTTPPCIFNCRPGYNVPYFQDKYYGMSSYMLPSNVLAIQEEIILRGPVTLGFDVYEDFIHYRSGVYKRTPGARYTGGHAVKAIGWGIENGIPYWLLANSWGTQWGENGFFKMARGINECNIEMNGIAGIPLNKL